MRRTNFSMRAASTDVAGARSLGALLAASTALKARMRRRLLERAAFFAINVSVQSLASGKYAALCWRRSRPPAFRRALFASSSRSPRRSTASRPRSSDPRAHARRLRNRARRFRLWLELARSPEAVARQYLKIDGRSCGASATTASPSRSSPASREPRSMLGVATIAEHVETAASRDRLQELEVTLGQGFYFGRPQPFAEIAYARSCRGSGRGRSRDVRSRFAATYVTFARRRGHL